MNSPLHPPRSQPRRGMTPRFPRASLTSSAHLSTLFASALSFPARVRCRLLVSISNSILFINLQIPSPATPFFSHLSETPGAASFRFAFLHSSLATFFYPVCFHIHAYCTPATPFFSQPSALPGGGPSVSLLRSPLRSLRGSANSASQRYLFCGLSTFPPATRRETRRRDWSFNPLELTCPL